MQAGSVLGVDAYTLGRISIAIAALGVILLLCRFVFGSGRRPLPPAHDYGLLVTVASLPTRAAADTARSMLAAHDIRSTLSDERGDPGPVHISADGRELPREPALTMTHVLVFPNDEGRARALLSVRG